MAIAETEPSRGTARGATLREGYIPVPNAQLAFREIGAGQPIVILHGGAEYDYSYLLPEMDLLSDSFRLIYYAQRGRGKSAGSVQPQDVTLASEIQDIEDVRNYFGLESIVLLGHSWGAVLAMEYAIHHPQRVSHLILLNTAPASRNDFLLFRESRLKNTPDVMAKLQEISSSAIYATGDLATDAAYYRIHFRSTVNPEYLERVVQSLRVDFTPDSVLLARKIDDRLMGETWLASEYDLLPELNQLHIPTLVIHSDHDFIPLESSRHISDAIPGAMLIVLDDCGHFSFLECPDQVRQAITTFLHTSSISNS